MDTEEDNGINHNRYDLTASPPTVIFLILGQWFKRMRVPNGQLHTCRFLLWIIKVLPFILSKRLISQAKSIKLISWTPQLLTLRMHFHNLRCTTKNKFKEW